ncbi:hypothetical protein evm_014688 [Chilo suppressalis]|nr:hypothetical protein evm_014688 [Chilo suppressalis]
MWNFFEKGQHGKKEKKTSQQTYDVNVDPEIIVDDGYHENDLGRYVGLATQLSTEKKRELLQHPWIPPRNYDFESDASHLKSTVRGILGSFMVRPYIKFKNMHEDCRKKFRRPWLTQSKLMKQQT